MRILSSTALLLFFVCSHSYGQSFQLIPYSNKGKQLKSFTVDVEQAVLCPQEPVTFEDVHLWMQMGEHGHGTSPVRVVETDGLCVIVKQMNFLMAGKWQLRFKTEKGRQVISFNVSR